MSKKIMIKVGHIQVEAELNNTKIAEAIWDKLPFEGLVKL